MSQASSGCAPGVTAAAPPAPSLLQKYPYTSPPTGQLCRVFLSHAGEQQRELVDIINEALQQRYPGLQGKVFLDEHWQKHLFDRIHECLQDAFVVVPILSVDFITKRHPMEELQLLMHWQQQGSPVKVLPVLYHITYEEVQAVIRHCNVAITASRGGAMQPLPPLPQHLSKVKQVVENLVRRGEHEALRWWSETLSMLQQQVKDLEQLLDITGLRRDQAPSTTVMRDRVVRHTVKLLRDMGQMPTHSKRQLPQVTADLDRRAEEVVQLLEGAVQSAGEGVKEPGLVKTFLLLLHGMGGIGKTTLAGKVFNLLHEQDPTVPCCFVELPTGVTDQGREEAQCHILQELAPQEVHEVRNVNDGQQKITAALCDTKVLLVLDNVWDEGLGGVLPADIMDVLGEGSIVLVTSRGPRAVQAFEGGRSWVHSHKVKLLDDRAAMELLCKLVRGQKEREVSPSEKEAKLMAELAHRCGGLPMALQAVGLRLGLEKDAKGQMAYFQDFDRAIQDTFARQQTLKADGERTLFAALSLNWCALREEAKETLLDLVGRVAEIPQWCRILQAYDTSKATEAYCEHGVMEELLQHGLIMVDGGEVKVHDTIVDFCRVECEARGECRDVWSIQEEVAGKLQAGALKGLVVKAGECYLTGAQLGVILCHHTSIRYLKVYAHVLREDGATVFPLQLPKELRWLRLSSVLPNYPINTKRSLQAWLVDVRMHARFYQQGTTLDLQGTQASLRVLELHGSLGGVSRIRGLTSTCKELRVLSIRWAPSLVLDDGDFAGLSNLEVLELASLARLEQLDLACLPGLQRLVLEDCPRLQRADLSGLECLESLHVESCGYRVTIHGLSSCTGLRVLTGHGLVGPDFGALGKLEVLDLKGSQAVPSELSLSRLTALRHLRLVKCEALQQLDISGLKHLERVELQGCRNLDALTGSMLGALVEVTVVPGKERLQWTNVVLRDAALLRRLNADLNSVLNIDLSGASSFESLVLKTKVEHVESFIGGLTTTTQKFPPCVESLDLSGTTSLRRLQIYEADRLHALLLDGCTKLDGVYLKDCTHLRQLNVPPLRNLRALHLTRCDALQTITGLEGSPALELVKVAQCSQLETLDLSGATALKALWVEGAGGLQSLHLRAVERLWVKDCGRLQHLDVSQLRALKTLQLHECHTLQQVHVTHLSQLKVLELFGCDRLAHVAGLDGVPRRSFVVRVQRCARFPSCFSGNGDLFAQVGGERFEEVMRGAHCKLLCKREAAGGWEVGLVVEGSPESPLPEVLQLQGLTSLRTLTVGRHWVHTLQLDVTGCAMLQDLRLVGGLDSVCVRGLQPTDSLSEAVYLKHLALESIDSKFQVSKDAGSWNLTALEELELHGDWGEGVTLGLACTPSLKRLRVVKCNSWQQQLGAGVLCSPLERVEVVECESAQAVVSGLARELEGLRKMWEEMEGDDHELQCGAVKALVVKGCGDEELDVRKLAALHSLELYDCKVQRVLGLSSLQGLGVVKVHDCKNLTGLVLRGLGGLEEVEVEGYDSLMALDVRGASALRRVKTSWGSWGTEAGVVGAG